MLQTILNTPVDFDSTTLIAHAEPQTTASSGGSVVQHFLHLTPHTEISVGISPSNTPLFVITYKRPFPHQLSRSV